MKWRPVKCNTENPAYVLKDNFDKMQQMENFYAHTTALNQNNKS